MMRIKLPALILIFLMVFSASLTAETWRFSARQVSSIQSAGKPVTVLDGDARVESDSMTILADHLELSGEGYNLISGFGGVDLTDKDRGIRIKSQSFEYDRESRIIRFREQVSLVDTEEGIVIRCESLDLLEEEELVLMQVAVRLIKDEIVCRGEFARFAREENTLSISGRPVVWREDDEYRADRINVNLDTEEIVMEGGVTGALTTEEDES